MRNSRLADIGESIGMTGAHLLYYFESKTALFLSSLQIVERDLRERALETFESMPTARERWEWLLRAATPEDRRDSDLSLWLEAWTEAVHDEDVRFHVEQLEKDWNELVTGVLAYGKERGELPDDLDVAEFVEGFAALLDGLSIRIVVGYRGLSRESAIRLCRSFSEPFLRWHDVPAALPVEGATR
ncbi:TetR family transcriptional regulator [Microbacterium sp. 4R-513]|uniref:TetR family transcriptional regulator C-terminal domain-containing protein n=1 Tax=Microbacterium sp. 4R-513 TaxID=2567934 RepID=UPI0013E1B5C8|nr:TetR family transcriptional regulator C-terminal domain-containing protein [Microbacterium sp. 4R-513]QIG39490.1 TetR family transcriptional regulator [Microbacterium sp. 4R-513]